MLKFTFDQGMALPALQERAQDWSEVHPALATPWQEGQLGAKEALELVDQTLQSAELEEELWVPRLGARQATVFHPGYGLLACPERALWTSGDPEHGLDDLAGIMGGERTGVTDRTTKMFLEAAIFDPISIAKTGRKLNIISEARYRFERGLDYDSPELVMHYAASLIQKICGGSLSKIVSLQQERNNKLIKFNPEITHKLTGVKIENKNLDSLESCKSCQHLKIGTNPVILYSKGALEFYFLF